MCSHHLSLQQKEETGQPVSATDAQDGAKVIMVDNATLNLSTQKYSYAIQI